MVGAPMPVRREQPLGSLASPLDEAAWETGAPPRGQIELELPPPLSNILPRIIFRLPPDLRHDEEPESRPVRRIPSSAGRVMGQPRYLINPKMCKVAWNFDVSARVVAMFKVLKLLLRDHGYEEETDLGADEWSLFCVNGFLEKVLEGSPTIDLRALQPHQKINRLPGALVLSDKGLLWRCFAAARAAHGDASLHFMPTHFVLPEELDTYEAHMRARLAAGADDIWILKPGNGSKGSGIFLHRPQPDSGWGGAVAPREVTCHRGVAARYIDPPYLMDGLKSDLRLYVLVTAVQPLRCYVYEEGLARFSTEVYSTEDLERRCAHLTNYSLNKHAAGFDASQADDTGSKRTLSAFRRRLESDVGGAAAASTWRAVDALIVHTMLAVQPTLLDAASVLLPATPADGASPFFQLLGFDVMLDGGGKPWLLEVNVEPSLDTDSPLDLNVKAPMVVDMLNLVGLHAPPPRSFGGGAAARAAAAARSSLAVRQSAAAASDAGPDARPRRMSRVELAQQQQLAIEEAELARSQGGGWRRLPLPGEPRCTERAVAA